MTNSRLVIGKITAAHGVRGEVTVFPLTDDARRFLKLKEVFMCKEDTSDESPAVIKSARIDRDRVLVKFEGCEDRDKAESFKGLFISIDRKDAVKLKEGSFFIEDLKTLEVTDDSKGELGTIKDVYKSGPMHIVMIQRSGKQDLLVPFAKEIFYVVRPEDGIVKCRLPEGLYEMYE